MSVTENPWHATDSMQMPEASSITVVLRNQVKWTTPISEGGQLKPFARTMSTANRCQTLNCDPVRVLSVVPISGDPETHQAASLLMVQWRPQKCQQLKTMRKLVSFLRGLHGRTPGKDQRLSYQSHSQNLSLLDNAMLVVCVNNRLPYSTISHSRQTCMLQLHLVGIRPFILTFAVAWN